MQVSFKVPQPEAFDLRRWLLEECTAFYQSTSEHELSDEQVQRLYFICDIEGALLGTPRDVVRTLNAIKLSWSAVRDKIDYSDLVWLQLVKLSNEALYVWIEQYLLEYAAISEGAAIEETRRTDATGELEKHLRDRGAVDARSIWRFQRFVPGVRPGADGRFSLFNEESQD